MKRLPWKHKEERNRLFQLCQEIPISSIGHMHVTAPHPAHTPHTGRCIPWKEAKPPPTGTGALPTLLPSLPVLLGWLGERAPSLSLPLNPSYWGYTSRPQLKSGLLFTIYLGQPLYCACTATSKMGSISAASFVCYPEHKY